MKDNNGTYIPPTIRKSSPVYFAIDNIDFRNDTPDGKNEFHGIGQVVYQQSIDEHHQSALKISREHTKSFKHNPFLPALICHKPVPPNKTYPYFIPPDLADRKLYHNLDSLWFLCRSLNTNTEVNKPKWAAYNSLVTEALQSTYYSS